MKFSNIRLWVAVLFPTILIGTMHNGLGWGSYGHQQIQHTALGLIESTPLGRCFTKSTPALVRLAISPDYDWKSGGFRPDLSAQAKRLKQRAGESEGPLHFFSVDAFTKRTPIGQLPTDPYEKSASIYGKLLVENMDVVQELNSRISFEDRKKASLSEVADLGTAPWRVDQLYHLGVDALREKKWPQALLYLGVMGHYIGDLSQPFHVTLNNNGEHYSSPAAGVHYAFETALLQDYASQNKVVLDDKTQLWGPLKAAGLVPRLEALSYLGENNRHWSEIHGSQWIGELFKLVELSHSYVEPLLQAYALSCKDENRSGGSSSKKAEKSPSSDSAVCVRQENGKRMSRVTRRLIQQFRSKNIQVGNQKISVLGVAGKQMGVAAAILSRMWLSAYDEAHLDAGITCNALDFHKLNVLLNYPKPDYVPDYQSQMSDPDAGDQ